MTIEQLKIILSGQPKDVVTALQKSSFVLPGWADLDKQYDPLKHRIITDTSAYPPKLNELGQDEFKRTPYALQKLAVNRISQALFAQPVERLYSSEEETDNSRKAKDILEQIYKTDNYIDSENIERGKSLNKSCQIATVWKVFEKPNIVKGIQAKLKLTHKTYSEPDGYKLYPQIDENGDLIVLTILYTDSEQKEHCFVYANLEKPVLLVYDKLADWVQNTDLSKELTFFPVIYGNISEPVWGGLAGTKIVEEIEEIENFDSLYIKKNASPVFVLDMGDTSGMKGSDVTEKTDDAKRIIKVGKGGTINDATWAGAPESTNNKLKRLRNAFFEQNQFPDSSFANFLGSNTSADNKELLFSDSRSKAEDLAGEWEKFFYAELNIIKEFAKIMFPSLATEFDGFSIRSVVKPYSIRTKKENAEYVSIAGNSMSQETKVRVLGEVDDISKEVEDINSEQSAAANQGF